MASAQSHHSYGSWCSTAKTEYYFEQFLPSSPSTLQHACTCRRCIGQAHPAHVLVRFFSECIECTRWSCHVEAQAKAYSNPVSTPQTHHDLTIVAEKLCVAFSSPFYLRNTATSKRCQKRGSGKDRNKGLLAPLLLCTSIPPGWT